MESAAMQHRLSAIALGLGLLAFVSLFSATAVTAASPSGSVTALGRLEPRDGVIRVSGPSLPAVVITDLLVEQGQILEKGALIARLDTYGRHRANVDAMRARLVGTQRDLERSKKLQVGRASSAAARDEAETEVKVASAHLAAAQARVRTIAEGANDRVGDRVPDAARCEQDADP